MLPAEAEAEAAVAAAAAAEASAAAEAEAAAAAAAEASAGAAAAVAASRGESEAKVRALDLSRLMGRVRGAGASSGRPLAEAYFGHFCTAIHLEFLQELTAVRARFERGGALLSKQGWALTGLRATEVKPARAPRGKPRAGAPAARAQGARVTFTLGRGGPGLERLRLRRGDSVVLSASDPLSDAVGEVRVKIRPNPKPNPSPSPSPNPNPNQGTLVGLSERQATVVLEPGSAGGEVAAARWLEHQGWRLDKGANRTSFKRQLDAVTG